MPISLRQENECASFLFRACVDASFSQRRTKVGNRLFATHVQTPLSPAESTTDIFNSGGKLFLRRRVDRANVVTLLINETVRSGHIAPQRRDG